MLIVEMYYFEAAGRYFKGGLDLESCAVPDCSPRGGCGGADMKMMVRSPSKHFRMMTLEVTRR